MILEKVSEFFTSPVLLKLCVALLLYLYFSYIRRHGSLPDPRMFALIIVLTAARDLLFFLLPLDALYYVTDVIILNAYLYWYSFYAGGKRFNPVFTAVSAAYIVVVLLLTILGRSQSFSLVLHLFIFLFIAYVGVKLYSLSSYNAENAEVILITRQWFAGIFVAFHVLSILFGYRSPFTQAILLPLSYSFHFIVLYNYHNLFDSDRSSQLEYLSNYLDSLFDFMRNIGNAISERIEMAQVLDYIVSSAVKNSNADAGAILLIDEFDDILTVKAVHGFFPPPYPIPKMVKVKLSGVQEYFQSTHLKLGQTILGEAAKTGEPVYIRNTASDARTNYIEDDTCFISSIIVIPLIVSKKILGVLSVIRRQKNQFFDEVDFDRVKTFADYASLTMDNLFTYMQLLEKQEIEREVGIAAEIQQKLLPRKIPRLSSASISAFSFSAKGVSGDYYDIIPIKKEGKVALVICDVAGKGVPASLVMVMIRTIIHLIAGAHQDASKIVTWINRGITGKIDIERFATLSFLTYDAETRQIEYSNAAHHPLMIYRNESKSIETVDTEGLPIGLEAQTRYGLATTTLEPGDILVLYTDGVIEAMNVKGEQYSYEALSKVIMENNNLEPDDLTEIIKTDIDNFVGTAKQHDDLTLLLMKVR